MHAASRMTHTNRSTRFGHTLLRDEHGANLVEYIILVGVIALVAIAGFKIFGETTRAKIDEQATKVTQIGN